MNKEKSELEKVNEEMKVLLEERKKIIAAGGLKEIIQSVGITTNWEFYDSEQYDERTGYEVIVESGAKFFMPIPKRAAGRSSLMQFALKYGSMPKVGMEVVIDCSGDYDKILL